MFSRRLALASPVLLYSAAAFAQQTGSIVGVVTDTSGAAIPDATVTLTNAATDLHRTVTSNSSGQYTAASLPAGIYTVTVEKVGFQRLERPAITLASASTVNLDLPLTVGSAAETVTVTSAASLLQSQSGVLSSLVDNKQMVALPLATRNFTDLVLLTPGAHTGSASNLAEGGSAYAIRGGSNFSVNGSIAAANSYLIDGVYDRNQWLNTLVLVPIVDSIQEYRVMTSNFNAEFGEAAGAITTVTTRSGSNAIHGSVWEFLRNDVMNANTYFAKQNGLRRAPYRRNTFGATIGGPILRDHTFFFGDYQGIRQSVPQTFTSTLPTLAQRNMVRTGNFSGFAAQLYNPYSTTTAGGVTTRAPFAGNQIPTNLLDPAAIALINLLPDPTNSNATNNYTISPALTQTTDQFDVRIDQNVGASDRLFFKYSFDQTEQVSPGTVATAASGVATIGPYVATGGNGTRTPVRTQSGTLGYSRVLSGATLLEAHAAVVRWRATVAPLGQGYAAASAIGIPGINYNALSGGLPGITISNFSTLGDNSSYPENSFITTFQYDGDVIHTAGRHTLKAGILFLRHRFNGFSAFPVRGTYDFNGQFTRQIGSGRAASPRAHFALGATEA
ncbi:MAG: carboxypeptidase-like regulatory domain-containing protein, partial [Terriglobus sp.]